jgi:hypothetical protein
VFGQATGSNGNFWFVVVPFLPYSSSEHPTGTVTATWSAGCSLPTGGAVQDSGATSAIFVTPGFPGSISNPASYWGFDTGVTGTPPTTCTSVTLSYSGDGHWLAFTETLQI